VAAALVDFALFLPVLLVLIGVTINYLDGRKGDTSVASCPRLEMTLEECGSASSMSVAPFVPGMRLRTLDYAR